MATYSPQYNWISVCSATETYNYTCMYTCIQHFILCDEYFFTELLKPLKKSLPVLSSRMILKPWILYRTKLDLLLKRLEGGGGGGGDYKNWVTAS